MMLFALMGNNGGDGAKDMLLKQIMFSKMGNNIDPTMKQFMMMSMFNKKGNGALY
jgi:hypothetical protein